VPVTSLRFAPLVGPHFPSPLGRYLRLPLVPVSGLSDLPFALLHQEDAASAIVAAIDHGPDGPVNVVAPGAVTASQAVRLGGRIPLPVVGPGWILARVAAEVFGAPLPDHIQELLTRGRVADGGRAESLLGVSALRSTPEVVKELFDWASVVYLPVTEGRAA
jgi:UDP-glucose 4-epimerase